MPQIIKNGAYVINLDEYADVGTHWIALHVKNNEVTYFDSFGVEHVNQKIYWTFRIQVDNSICVDTFVLDSLILCLQEEV